MKYKAVPLSKKLHFVLLIVSLYGCSSGISIKDHVNDWMSRPVSELKQAMKSPDSYASKIRWKETAYPLAGGNSVYVEPLSEDCSIHWEVTPRGTIIRYRAAGKGCEEESSSDTFRRTLMPPPQ